MSRSGEGMLKESNNNIFESTRDYSTTIRGGQLKIRIEFDIQTQ